MNILVVCTGNTCRSAMAEGYLQTLLPDCDVSSAGVFAYDGDGASPLAVEVMREVDVDISAHRSRRVTQEIMDESDIILCVTEGHRRALCDRYDVKDKCFTLGQDVDDPYGANEASYRVCRDILLELLDKVADKIGNNTV